MVALARPVRYRARRMPAAPVTLEGWYVLHEMWAVDWQGWTALDPAAREAAVREATALFEVQARPADGHSAFFSLLTQKGDLCCLHWRRSLEALRQEEVVLRQTRLAAFLRPTYSYITPAWV